MSSSGLFRLFIENLANAVEVVFFFNSFEKNREIRLSLFGHGPFPFFDERRGVIGVVLLQQAADAPEGQPVGEEKEGDGVEGDVRPRKPDEESRYRDEKGFPDDDDQPLGALLVEKKVEPGVDPLVVGVAVKNPDFRLGDFQGSGERLLLAEERVSMDGRLRENVTAIPDGRWLNLFNVGYILTDKLHDAWLDGVFYDLQFGARLVPGESAQVACVPQFEATALGLVSYLDGVPSLADGTLVGVAEVGFADGITRTFALRAGENVTADEKATRLHWSPPGTAVAVTVRSMLADG
ncbi:MAG: hypothetical protein ABIN58_07770, partial [candidate division WOR-3 bacterium]